MSFRSRLILAIVVAVACVAGILYCAFTGYYPWSTAGVLFVCTYALFAWIMLVCKEDSFVQDIFLDYAFRSFSMPGVIFSLDWDGIKFLILAKLLFAAISAILSIGCFVIVMAFSVLVAAVMFPFVLPGMVHETPEEPPVNPAPPAP